MKRAAPFAPLTGAAEATMNRDGCRGCEGSARLKRGEVERILEEYLCDHPAPLADEAPRRERLRLCRACPDLLYGTTCFHCGCLVAVRACLADKHCPRPGGRSW